MQDGRRDLLPRSAIHIRNPRARNRGHCFSLGAPFVQGFVRDLRVRWALEKVGLPYGERLIGTPKKASNDDRALQPFGQVPACEEDGPVMLGSGAIVLHIAELSAVLMPAEAAARPACRPECSRR